MKTEMTILAFALSCVFLASVLSAASTTSFISTYSEFQYWIPVIMLAVLVSVMITAIYYVIGVILDSKKVKGAAVSELGQAIGTGVLVIIIIAVFTLVGTTSLSLSSLVAPSALSGVCANSLSTSSIDLINSVKTMNGYATPANQICSAVSTLANSTADITDRINYGMYASYIIIANLTNQSAHNINSLYDFETWLGFLANFRANTQICGSGTPPDPCILPWVPRLLNIAINYTPLSGYTTLTSVTSPLESEADLTFYILFMQLLIITVLLYAWPYLLAAGIVLRSTMFTRKLGGLLMGIALVSVLIYPLMYVIEYSSFTSQNLGPIGASNLPSRPLYEQQFSSEGGNVLVYGSAAHGYVATNSLSSIPSGCSAGQYVYEAQCGNTMTLNSGTCTSSQPLQYQFCTVGGYVPASAPNLHNSCSGSPYVYESQCGNPATAGSCASSSVAASQLCPTSGYVPGYLFPKANCPSGEWVEQTNCADPSQGYVSSPSTSIPTCVSYSNIPTDPTTGQLALCNVTLNSNINFFQLPRADQVLNYYSCLPVDAFGNVDVVGDEAAFSAFYLIPGFSAVAGIGSAVTGLPVTPLDILGGCKPSNAIGAVFSLTNMYGVTFVSSIFTLLLNAIVALAAIAGISGLMGGDTSILGLSRLI